MSYTALVSHFADRDVFPVQINEVLEWIKQNTDFRYFAFHEVNPKNKSFYGSFRKRAIPTGRPYSDEYDIKVDILYGSDLDKQLKRLVICKELLHVFDVQSGCANSPEKIKVLIPAIIMQGQKVAPPAVHLLPAMMDSVGPYKALAVLIPKKARLMFKAAVESNSRTVEDVASFVDLPPSFVDIWLRSGDELEKLVGLTNTISEHHECLPKAESSTVD